MSRMSFATTTRVEDTMKVNATHHTVYSCFLNPVSKYDYKSVDHLLATDIPGDPPQRCTCLWGPLWKWVNNHTHDVRDTVVALSHIR